MVHNMVHSMIHSMKQCRSHCLLLGCGLASAGGVFSGCRPMFLVSGLSFPARVVIYLGGIAKVLAKLIVLFFHPRYQLAPDSSSLRKDCHFLPPQIGALNRFGICL